MTVNRHKQILAIQVYKVQGIEVVSASSEKWESLPEWAINIKGEIVDINDWNEEIVPEVEYLMIEMEYADPLLGYEISNAGLNEIMSKVNLLPVIYKLPSKKTDNYDIGPVGRIVVEMVYRCGGGWEQTDYDCDLDIELVGYLDDNLNLIKVPTHEEDK